MVLLYTKYMNLGIIIVIAIAGLWGLGIFFGVIGGFAKTFKPTPFAAMDSSSSKAKEHQIIEDTKEKQQQMMDDLRQKMEDQQSQRN